MVFECLHRHQSNRLPSRLVIGNLAFGVRAEDERVIRSISQVIGLGGFQINVVTVDKKIDGSTISFSSKSPRGSVDYPINQMDICITPT